MNQVKHIPVPQINFPKPKTPETRSTHGYFIDQEWLEKRKKRWEESRVRQANS